jgi:hypothetical protein
MCATHLAGPAQGSGEGPIGLAGPGTREGGERPRSLTHRGRAGDEGAGWRNGAMTAATHGRAPWAGLEGQRRSGRQGGHGGSDGDLEPGRTHSHSVPPLGGVVRPSRRRPDRRSGHSLSTWRTNRRRTMGGAGAVSVPPCDSRRYVRSDVRLHVSCPRGTYRDVRRKAQVTRAALGETPRRDFAAR